MSAISPELRGPFAEAAKVILARSLAHAVAATVAAVFFCAIAITGIRQSGSVGLVCAIASALYGGAIVLACQAWGSAFTWHCNARSIERGEWP